MAFLTVDQIEIGSFEERARRLRSYGGHRRLSRLHLRGDRLAGRRLRADGVGRSCIGERGDRRPEDFDFGDSPAEIAGFDFARADEDELCARYLRSRLLGLSPDKGAVAAAARSLSHRVANGSISEADADARLAIGTIPFSVRVETQDGSSHRLRRPARRIAATSDCLAGRSARPPPPLSPRPGTSGWSPGAPPRGRCPKRRRRRPGRRARRP